MHRYQTNNKYKLVKIFSQDRAQQITCFSAVNGFHSCILPYLEELKLHYYLVLDLFISPGHRTIEIMLYECKFMKHTAISINVVGSKYKAIRQDLNILWIFVRLSSSKSAMPRPSSEDIRWRAIWMNEMLGYQMDEVAASLKMSLSFKL